MQKLTVLIADDQRAYRDQVIDWFINQPINTYFAPYVECKYIKQKVDGDINFETIIKKLEQLDIAFVDMQWLEDGFNGWEGGFYIIDKIETKFPFCLILPVTQFRFVPEVHPEVKSPSGKRYDAIPKEGDDLDKTTRFFSYLEKWQIDRLKRIKNTKQWFKILSALEKIDNTRKIIIENDEWDISDFIFPEISFNDKIYFIRENLISLIKNLISYPKNILWGNENLWGKHTETYFKFIEIDEENGFQKLAFIESRAKEYISNFVDILIAKDRNQLSDTLINRAKTQQLRSHQCKGSDIPEISKISKISDIPDDYFDNLLIRYIVMTLCHIAEKANKLNWNSSYLLYELFDHAEKSESNVKQFYHYLGFSLNRKKSIHNLSYAINIFFTEKKFLEEFDFQSQLNKITLNN